MKNKNLIGGPLLAEIVSLETKVWEALVAGDPKADGQMLTEDFIGVYPSGFSNKGEHCGQLTDGPVMETYLLSKAQLRMITQDAVLLSYLARYRKAGHEEDAEMYISSLWERHQGQWLNSFSQDTPAD